MNGRRERSPRGGGGGARARAPPPATARATTNVHADSMASLDAELQRCRAEVGLPLPAEWEEREVRRLFAASVAAGRDVVCGGEPPRLPCSGMRGRARAARAALEAQLEHRARAAAHRAFYSAAAVRR
jgi:hypothetical protein